MAVLTEEDKKTLWTDFMSEASSMWELLSLSKSELRAALDAIYQWILDNQASFNQAIPLPARTVLNQKQKLKAFMWIVKRMWEVE